jgi:hypothetical protein
LNSPKPKPVIITADGNESSAPSLRRIVRNSALLNLVIVLTSCPVLLIAGGPKAVYPTLAIMVGISVFVWIATFALFCFVPRARLFRMPVSPLIVPDPTLPAEEVGVADRWLDGPE